MRTPIELMQWHATELTALAKRMDPGEANDRVEARATSAREQLADMLAAVEQEGGASETVNP